MRTDWSDVNARVAGLTTRLLSPRTLRELRATRSLSEFVARLAATRALASAPAADAPVAAIEEGVRRVAADRLRLLERWLGPRRDAVRVVYEDEERRAVRALLRGAAQGAPPEQRVAGLLPTTVLDETTLARLEKCADPPAVLAVLESIGHPFATDLRDVGVGATTDLYRLELALDRAFARRARTASRHPGLSTYVTRVLDLRNAWAALLTPPGRAILSRPDPFVEGGRLLDRGALADIASRGDVGERRRLLAERFRGSGLSGVFEPSSGELASLERMALEALIREQDKARRRDPSGPLALVVYTLRLRRELLELGGVLWGLALGRPTIGSGGEPARVRA
jgi:vacuolar-type H+-ATPase subunit C/Vma6